MNKKPNKFKILFFDGLIAILPISITIYIIYLIIIFFYKSFDFFIPFFPVFLKKNIFFNILIVISTIFLTIIIILIVGLIAKTLAGKAIEKFIENLLSSVPVINTVYKGFKQLFNLIVKNKEDKSSKVVFIEYPCKGKWAIAFLTGKCNKKSSPIKNKNFYTVFLPTTPNPTTGFLLFLQKKQIKESDLTMDEAVKLILSGGIMKDDRITDNT